MLCYVNKRKLKLITILSSMVLIGCGGGGGGESSDSMPNPTPSTSPDPAPNPTPTPTPTPNPQPEPEPKPEVIPEGVGQLTATLHEAPSEPNVLDNVMLELTNETGQKFSYPLVYLANGVEMQSGRYTISSYMLGENKHEYTLSHDQIELYPNDNKTIAITFQKVEPEPEPEPEPEESEHIALMPFKDVSFNMLWSTVPPRSNLQEIADVSKHYDYVLAFITQNAWSDSCFPAWGGSPELALDKALYVNEVNYLKNQGGTYRDFIWW